MYKELLDRLSYEGILSEREYIYLIEHRDDAREYAASLAREIRRDFYGDRVYIRGLIEFTNYCKNNCYYCVPAVRM